MNKRLQAEQAVPQSGEYAGADHGAGVLTQGGAFGASSPPRNAVSAVVSTPGTGGPAPKRLPTDVTVVTGDERMDFAGNASAQAAQPYDPGAAAAQAQQHQSIIPQHGYYSAPSFGALGPPVSTVSSMLSTLSAIPAVRIYICT